MTDAVSGMTGTTGTKATTTVERKDSGSQKDVFLKLLVAQMKYQDPRVLALHRRGGLRPRGPGHSAHGVRHRWSAPSQTR